MATGPAQPSVDIAGIEPHGARDPEASRIPLPLRAPGALTRARLACWAIYASSILWRGFGLMELGQATPGSLVLRPHLDRAG